MSLSKNNKKRLFIIDGYATLYRAHYALIKNPLTTTAGLETSAVFGFANQVFQLLEEEKPDYIAVGSFFKSKLKSSATKAQKKILIWAKERTNLPIVAIGGINNKNYKTLMKFGVNYLAISSFIWNNPRLKPKDAIKKFN